MSEKTLLHSERYFGRVRELIGEGKSQTEAWAQVEFELSSQFRVRRFVSIESFRDGFRNELPRKRTGKPQKVILVEE